ncbi:hypothetical protein KIPB_008168 [Kipferlia bialata]|uniref:Uncharacterized protein n=1 Tax=Kipferlia bialata TaxID=797122 RepID=A0A9K3D1H2_9EUKA|nr:hypothetical protein KIPB_008168 [Kipferlia bialata]|eukprot:g8168.t1
MFPNLITCDFCVDTVIGSFHTIHADYDGRTMLKKALTAHNFDAHSFHASLGPFAFGFLFLYAHAQRFYY